MSADQRAVYVVETWLSSDRRWVEIYADIGLRAAQKVARENRARFPGKKFRTVKYVSTKP